MYRIIGSDQKTYGPVNGRTVQQWIDEHRLIASSLLQAEGSAEWRPVSSFPEFKVETPPALPPPPIQPLPPQPAPLQPQPAPIAPAAPAQGNSLASLGLVLGILSVIPCCCGLPGYAGLIVSILALNQANALPDKQGKAAAVAGIVLSCVGIASGLGFSVLSMLKHSRLHWGYQGW